MSKKFKQSISDKLANELAPKKLLDPEENSEDELKLAEIDSDENSDYGKAGTSKKLSDFRKSQVKLLSEQSVKYKGKITSRKELDANFVEEYEDSDDSSNEENGSEFSGNEEFEEKKSFAPRVSDKNSDATEESSDDSGDSELETYRKQLKNCQLKDEDRDESFSTDDEIESQSKTNEQNAESSDDSDYGSSGEDSNQSEIRDKESNLVSDTNQNSEIQKGLAVQNQLKLWEKLLEVRIHSQKILIQANALPPSNFYEKISTKSSEFTELANETTKNVENLLEKMLEMQKICGQQYSEMKESVKGKALKRPSSENESSGSSSKRFATELQNDFESLRPYRNSVLQKWDDRTKILTPGAGGKKSESTDFDILKKIETVLLNKSDLIKKSQTVKGSYKLFGEGNLQETDNQKEKHDNESGNNIPICSPNIYDDTDFYHQQLRELIEHKTNTSSNPTEMSKQFIELQKLRQKIKKKVDTRASKGRKIRYIIHNKLVNFMAPEDNSNWTEDTKNELFRSLFSSL